MPSLPSLPAFEDSAEHPTTAETESEADTSHDLDLISPHPIQSTPAPLSSRTNASTIRPPASTGSTARFANSIASRSTKSSFSASRTNQYGRPSLPPDDNSFDISSIPSLPDIHNGDDMDIRSSDQYMETSRDSLEPDGYVPPPMGEDDDLEDITDALRSISRSGSPPLDIGPTPKKNYDYSVSLRSEPKPSSFDKLRNVSFRRPLSRTRTPSLSRTTPSPNSSASHSTPHSLRSIQYPRSQTSSPLPGLTVPLPRSATASPTAAFSPRQPRQGDNEPFTTDDEQYQHSQSEQDMSVDIDENEQHPSSLNHQAQTSQDTGTNDEREPTFSSSEGLKSSLRDASSTSGHGLMPSPAQLASAFNSPSSMNMFTPTPAFQPRPRARFNALSPASIPLPPSTTPQDTPVAQPQPQSPPPQYQQVSNITAESESEHVQHTDDITEEDEEANRTETERAVRFQPDDPTTPYATHKRSFLISVINSTARPRLKHLTPHPNRFGNDHTINETQGEVGETPVPNRLPPVTPGSVSGLGLNNHFAGVTPRPRGPVRRRISGPFTPFTAHQPASSTTTGTTSSASASSGPVSAIEHKLDSPHYESDRASFISTTSSQDLTTHARANASFDPIIGLGERGGTGLGRFNANKLNNYLHGLNRKLQEENEMLVERIRAFEEREKANGLSAVGKEDVLGDEGSPSVKGSEGGDYDGLGLGIRGDRRRSGGRRVSAGPMGLNDVREDVSAELWVEEKAALEEEMEELKVQLTTLHSEKEGLESALERERNERAEDKERWKIRMGEVHQGVEGIVKDLEGKASAAEQKVVAMEQAKNEALKDVKDAERRLAEVIVERDVLLERVEQAEEALKNGKDLGSELNEANEKVGKVMTELRNANIQIKDLEEEVSRADEKIDGLERQARELKSLVKGLEEQLSAKSEELEETLKQFDEVEEDFAKVKKELDDTKLYATQLEEDTGEAMACVETLKNQIATSEEKIEEVMAMLEEEREKTNHLENDNKRTSELARQMEDALEAAETKMRTDEEELSTLKAKVIALERELDRSRSQSHINTTHIGLDSEAQADIEALENELADAHKEIARLTTLINQSPARKAIEKAKDTRIELLEKEKEDLQERLKSMRNSSFAYPAMTPNRRASLSGMSPLHRQILSMKSPKTPGGPLRDLSWLQTTFNDASVAPLVQEIERLQNELDRANEDIDDKLDRLEDAGVGVISLTNQLEDAKAQILSLEEEIGRLARREERRTRRLEKARCQKCRTKVDLRGLIDRAALDESSILDSSDISLPSNPPTPPTKTSEKLRSDLRAVNDHLASMKQQWETERRKLLGENAVLQDAAQRLNAEVRNAKSEIQRYADSERAGERSKAAVQNELDKAKRTVEELEAELSSERSRLRSLNTEQTQAERQKEKLNLQLRRTESDMADIKEQLQKMKQENHDLEKELRSNANAEQKARLLELKVQENINAIDQLRQERSLLVADHKDLQKRYSEVTKHVSQLRSDHAASQTSHDNRRHQLDLQLLEISDLKKALQAQTSSLQRIESEKARLSSEKSEVAQTVSQLEADLRRVKRDAEQFGKDLKILRDQKDRLEKERSLDGKEMEKEREAVTRERKQNEAKMRILREELTKLKSEGEKLKGHICAIDETQLSALRLQHNKECKGLIVQIRYLKAKFTRESTLRSDLGYQKSYLLALLGRSERTEQRILSAIARIGFLSPPPSPPHSSSPSKKPRLRSIVISLIFIQRAERASENWRMHTASKEAIAVALQEVRKRRTTTTTALAPVEGGAHDKGKGRAEDVKGKGRSLS
ncbi:hypothetical protein C8Q75DRAFT_879628 [Abortiporus biennis]|nr:hypothetical protein C8Q75DRAFT_879628 [Abortiporus biennis]